MPLPLHDRVDGGGMTRITEACYWEGTGTPGTLLRHVLLLRTCPNPVLAAVQRIAHQQELTPIEVVRLAIRHGPRQHWSAVLTALEMCPRLAHEAQRRTRANSGSNS